MKIFNFEESQNIISQQPLMLKITRIIKQNKWHVEHNTGSYRFIGLCNLRGHNERFVEENKDLIYDKQ